MDQATVDQARGAALIRRVVRLPDRATARKERLAELLALLPPGAKERKTLVSFPVVPAYPLSRRERRTRSRRSRSTAPRRVRSK